MGKHSKDDGALYTHAERKEITHGTKHMRLGQDSVHAFDCCALSLSHPRHPVVCPSGFLFEKEIVVQHMLDQKKAARLRKAAEDEAGAREANATAVLRDAEAANDEHVFVAREESVCPIRGPPREGSTAVRAKERKPSAANFWLPEPEEVTVERGDVGRPLKPGTRCPISGKKLRLKDLRTVVFKSAPDSVIDGVRKPRFECPVCLSILQNSSKPAVLASGNVLCSKCLTKTVGTHGRDPITDDLTSMKTVIYLQAGGSSFAASAGRKEAKLYRPSAR